MGFGNEWSGTRSILGELQKTVMDVTSLNDGMGNKSIIHKCECLTLIDSLLAF